MTRSTGFGRLTIEAAYLRCEGLCEGCGRPLRGERGAPDGHAAHHRRPRQMGGTQRADTNGIENAVMLNADCHAHVESHRSWSYEHGFLVRQNDIPAAVPVALHSLNEPAGWMLLTDDAGYRPVEQAELPEVT